MKEHDEREAERLAQSALKILGLPQAAGTGCLGGTRQIAPGEVVGGGAGSRGPQCAATSLHNGWRWGMNQASAGIHAQEPQQ